MRVKVYYVIKKFLDLQSLPVFVSAYCTGSNGTNKEDLIGEN